MEQDMNQESTPIRPERLMKSISKYSDDDAVFSIDVGTLYSLVNTLPKLIGK